MKKLLRRIASIIRKNVLISKISENENDLYDNSTDAMPKITKSNLKSVGQAPSSANLSEAKNNLYDFLDCCCENEIDALIYRELISNKRLVSENTAEKISYSAQYQPTAYFANNFSDVI